MGLRRVDLPRPGINPRKVCPARVIERVGKRGAPLQGRSLFEYRVHGNGRSDLYPDFIQLEMDT